jgi:hypothetical protein
MNGNTNSGVAVLVHELTHALGFTDDMFDKFIDAEGQPIPQTKVRKRCVATIACSSCDALVLCWGISYLLPAAVAPIALAVQEQVVRTVSCFHLPVLLLLAGCASLH